ncbi:PAS domain S-box protein [Nitrospira sp. MA-1]|nr:PAS domain S-box protein [Nitrospira sp. MA-1]
MEAARTTPPTILVVDDETDICLALSDLLGNEGYQVDSVETGNEALRRAFLPHPYSAVILDLGLPDLDGLIVLQRLYSQDATLPVIILTAHGDQKEKIATLQHHAFAHLIKPYDRHEVVEMVHRAVAVKNLAWKAVQAEEALTSSEAQRQVEQQRTHTLLSESERRLNLALKAGNMGIWDWHIPTNHLIWSEEVSRIFGLGSGKFDGTNEAYMNCVHLEDRLLLGESIRRTLENDAPYEVEHRVVWPTGEVRWVACKGQVVEHQQGHPQRMLGTVQDITIRKQADIELRNSELFLNSIVENIPYTIFVKEAKNLRYLRFNKAGEALVGYPTEKLIGKTDYDFFSKSEADFFTGKDREVLASKTLLDVPEEVIHTTSHGTRYLHTKKIPLLDANGDPLYLLGISDDITAQKQAELERREQEILLHLIFETGPGCIKRVAADGTLLHINPAGLELIDAEHASEVLGHSVFDLVVPEHLDAFKQMHQEVIQGKKRTLQFEVQSIKGTRIWIETYAVPFKNPITNEVEHLAVTHDITKRKQADLDLVERNRLLELDIEVTTVINQKETIPDLLQGCTDALVRHLGAAFARIWCLDEPTQVLKLCASSGLYTHLDGPHSRVPMGKFKIGLIAAERKPILTNMVIGDPRVPDQEWAKQEGMMAFAGYPLVSNQEVLGVMGLFARHPLTEFTLKSLGMVADRITVALERQVTKDEKNKLALFQQRLLASMEEGIYGLDLDGNATFVNPAVLEMTGYEESELVGHSSHVLLHHSKPNGAPYSQEECLIHNSLRDGSVYHIDTEVFWRKDGSSFPVEYVTTPIQNDQGKLEGAVVAFQDITQRKQAEKVLQESEERFRLLNEAIPQQVWTARADGSLDYVNQRVIEYFGCPFEEMIGDGWQRFLHPEDLPGCLERWAEARNTRQAYEIEFRLLRAKDKTFRWFLGRALPIFDQHDEVVKWFGTNTDITQLKELENQVRQSQKMEAIGTLAGGIAHDFNNILMAIIGYTELAKQSARENVSAQKNLDEVLVAGQRAKELVQQILAFSRQTEQSRQPLDLQLVVKEVCKFLRATFPATIDIRQKFSGATSIILGDPIQMHQVLMNLCANAEYAMRGSGGILELQLEHVTGEPDGIGTHPDLQGGSYVCLTVRDSGSGMTPEVVQRIFDPFFTTKEVGEGTGMGLAVVHGIVISHGGVMKVESQPGQGAIFSLYFPEMEAASYPGEDTPLQQEVFMGRGYILFVEDEEPLARLGEEAMKGLGYEVMVRTSSVEALEVFRADPLRFDAVVTDQTMPHITGEALARQLLELRPDVPIILCTGFSHSMTPEKAKAMGIRAFLLKPLLIKDLARTLRDVLNS